MYNLPQYRIDLIGYPVKRGFPEFINLVVGGATLSRFLVAISFMDHHRGIYTPLATVLAGVRRVNRRDIAVRCPVNGLASRHGCIDAPDKTGIRVTTITGEAVLFLFLRNVTVPFVHRYKGVHLRTRITALVPASTNGLIVQFKEGHVRNAGLTRFLPSTIDGPKRRGPDLS